MLKKITKKNSKKNLNYRNYVTLSLWLKCLILDFRVVIKRLKFSKNSDLR